jgi:hypothetical protein
MIRNITPGPGINISGNVYNAPYYIDTTKPSAGLVRYQGGNFEVFDGSSWLPLQSSYPMIELDGVTQEAVAWVKRKMVEEKRLEELAKSHPAVADAIDAVRLAEKQLKTVVALCTV